MGIVKYWSSIITGLVIYRILFLIPLILLLSYFRFVDFYENEFFNTGVTSAYNLARIAFIIYLFAAICAPGYAALRTIDRKSFAELPGTAQLAAAFFCGASLWHALLLILGLLDLYLYPVGVALIVIAVAYAATDFDRTTREILHRIRGSIGEKSPTALATHVLVALAVVAAALLLIVKGLYPAGGHDYFNHYHGYYEAVLRNHGLQPNEVWYQFFYSKGMGLFFLASLLTDPLAPSLVTYCFALAAAVSLFLLVKNSDERQSFWPWIAVTAYLAFYIYTPGWADYRSNGGWGDFEKPHEIGAAFVVGFVWLCSEMTAALGGRRVIWFAAATCIFITAFIETVTVLLLGLVAAMMTAVALAGRRWRDARAFVGLATAGGSGLLAVLAANYLATGLISDQLLPVVWPWTDVRALARWGALPEVTVFIRDLIAFRAAGIHWLSPHFIDFVSDFLRFDLLKPLFGTIVIFLAMLGVALARRRWRSISINTADPLWLLGTVVLALIVAAAAVGAGEPISFFRYTSFCLPIVIALAACGWLYITASVPAPVGWCIRYLLPPVLLAVALGQFWKHENRYLKQIVPNTLAFVSGAMSIRDAYGAQQGWAGRHEWGGIFPGIVGAWRVAGANTRIWNMHLGAYCMLPHCRSETYFSFILSPHLLDMLAGSAEDTRSLMQAEGLNYFFYTTEMDLNDILPLTKPFAPDAIADYIGVKWTDGTSYLLTWLGPGVTPLTPEWVAQYKGAVANAPYYPKGVPLGLLLSVRDQMRNGARWGTDLTLK